MAFPKLEDHVFRVLENHFRLQTVADRCDWMLDLRTETLTFYEPQSQRVVLELPVQLVGTEDSRSRTWLWAWANAQSGIPEGMLEAVRKLKSEASAAGAEELYQNPRPFHPTHQTFGAEVTILAAGVSDGFTTFRCPFEGDAGAAYVVVESCPRAAKLPPDPMRTGKAILEGISQLSFDHRAAVEAYLGQPDAAGVYPPGITIEFDDKGRVGNLGYTLKPEDVKPEPEHPKSPLDRLKGLFRRS